MKQESQSCQTTIDFALLILPAVELKYVSKLLSVIHNGIQPDKTVIPVV